MCLAPIRHLAIEPARVATNTARPRPPARSQPCSICGGFTRSPIRVSSATVCWPDSLPFPRRARSSRRRRRCSSALVAGVLVVGSVLFFERTAKLDDPVGAISVHGVNGVWGVLALGLFADGTYGQGWNHSHWYPHRRGGLLKWLAEKPQSLPDGMDRARRHRPVLRQRVAVCGPSDWRGRDVGLGVRRVLLVVLARSTG